MANNPLTFLPLWLRALEPEVEIGIAFEVSGVDRGYFKTMLYEARRASKDPRLQELIMFAPAAPHDGEIWICRKQVELDA